ncbi:alpha-L-rhamnosidase C-terminal domain-containing protein [Mahella australiensis]|uniref:Alpha-L-rhamnosidase n=1 Tax=Mahella australiensis (strain DSM 15567 / CIP 107919 / 50-1 BON) TaxID=697281 RepID=F3ZW10_MAHA5|nr:alpha-L-rhamnosidase C-terminal domain-containing protein [Mahella australiensis]AEE96390.1 alpha-L-rhamnosidase [Mahella australiensis 50-1 BON]
MPFEGEAKWIWSKDGFFTNVNTKTPYKTAYFRRSFDVPAHGLHLTVHVSADSRYILYLNGRLVARGPAKGDIAHQFYDTVVLDGWLQTGQNVLSAVVVSFADAWPTYGGFGGPNSVMSVTSAFILDGCLANGDGRIIEELYTDEKWKVMDDIAYGHHPDGTITGMSEDLDGCVYPWGWQAVDFDDRAWQRPFVLSHGVRPDTVTDNPLPYRLIPRMIPMMEESKEWFSAIYQRQRIDFDDRAFLTGFDPMVIPANTTVSFVLDAGSLATGFPIVELEKGAGATVRLTYSEAWYENERKSPYHIPDKGYIEGVHDTLHCSGDTISYEPMLWRTFRYVKVDIATTDKSLVLKNICYRFIAYPFEELAYFESSDPRHKKIWDMSLRTIRLCSHETFEDCPYYEQMQYASDSQVVSLIAGYVSGDWRLSKQAILHFNWSRNYEGITMSRYPSRVPQIIPSWSLLWVIMVSDYWMHTGDEDTVVQCLDGVASVLHWFESYLNREYLLEKLPYWEVVDWVKEWDSPNGCPPGAQGGVTAVISLQYAAALLSAIRMMEAFGRPQDAQQFTDTYNTIIESVQRTCWSEQYGLFRDRPGYDEFSELGNAWAILAGAASDTQVEQMANKLGRDKRMAKATLYGRFYVFRALSKAGAYDVAGRLLDIWYEMMQSDLTTWPEEPYLARSFCHAWSTAPIYEFLAEILGVKPLKPGFKEVLVSPHVLDLDYARGEVPTPYGVVHVEWERQDDILQCFIRLPKGVNGRFVPPGNMESHVKWEEYIK